jgi:hypothetical protein
VFGPGLISHGQVAKFLEDGDCAGQRLACLRGHPGPGLRSAEQPQADCLLVPVSVRAMAVQRPAQAVKRVGESILGQIAAPEAVEGKSAGPLQTLTTSGGQPALAVSSMFVDRDQASDGEAYVVNSARYPVTITAVSAVVIPGIPPGELVQVAIAATGAAVAATRGWPPPVPVRPAIGGTLGYGTSGIIFGVRGPRIGDYAIAGVKITYDYHGQVGSTIAWAANVACVVASWRTDGSQAACTAYLNTIATIGLRQ